MRNLYRYLFLSLILSLTTVTAIADERYPLEPPDTSSPRATMESFQSVMRDTYFDHAVCQWIATMLTLSAGALMIVIFVLPRRRTVFRDGTGILPKVSRLLLPLGAMIVIRMVDYLILLYSGPRRPAACSIFRGFSTYRENAVMLS